MDKFREKIGHEIGQLEGAFKGIIMLSVANCHLNLGRAKEAC